MAMMPFLAMTAAEMRNISVFPPKIAWMACHFSPYGLGLSNLPKELPPGSLLIVDDFTPPCRHDPALIAQQLSMCVESLECCGVLLDFQRRGCEETQSLAKYLTEALSCPTAVSEIYGNDLLCPVFLPPVPLTLPPEEYLLPWKDREVWLELGTDGEIITLTEEGASVNCLPYPEPETTGLCDESLHCHYRIHTNEKSARFTLWRSKADFDELSAEVERLGVTTLVGLYQQLQ